MSAAMRAGRIIVVASVTAIAVACGGRSELGDPPVRRVDPPSPPSPHAPLADAGARDAAPPSPANDGGHDAGIDASTDASVDAGFDAGFDGGVDAGLDSGVDAGFDGGQDSGVDAGSATDAGECIYPETCVPTTCSQACGVQVDGCGGLLQCGPPCVVADTCIAETCDRHPGTCGVQADGCGGIIDCGSCPTGFACWNTTYPPRCVQLCDAGTN